MEETWKMVETCICPLIEYGNETWNPGKGEMKEINRILDNILKRILMTPTTTPREALYLETGINDPEHSHLKGKILMRNRLEKTKNELIGNILDLNDNYAWSTRVDEISNLLEISGNYKQSRKEALKKEVSEKIAIRQFKTMSEKENTKSKISYLIQGQEGNDPTGKRKPYMEKLDRFQVSTIFKARTRMLDIKNNFRGKYNDLLCRGCGQASETQEHVLEQCAILHPEESTKVPKNEIFDEEPENLKTVSKKIDRTMKHLSQSEVHTIGIQS